MVYGQAYIPAQGWSLEAGERQTGYPQNGNIKMCVRYGPPNTISYFSQLTGATFILIIKS